ncbi:hypothetical protein BGZ68_010257 [Mortierella alpina]|nr:hypothetical protein BGZ68_010257 [Mortierella alpina]
MPKRKKVEAFSDTESFGKSSTATADLSDRKRPLDDDEDDELSEGEFEVEEICGIRFIQPGETPQFNVKWLGYPYDSNTWEPLENLSNCLGMVKEYLLTTFALQTLDTTEKSKVQTSSTIPSEYPAMLVLSSPSSFPPMPSSMPPTPSALSWRTSPTSTIMISNTGINVALPSSIPVAPLSRAEALRRFEEMLNASPGPRITVENTVDDVTCPDGFVYISSPVYGKDVLPPDVGFASHCSCEPGDCRLESCECLSNSQGENEYLVLPFEKDGRVREQATNLLYECSELCGCGPNCISKASQRGRQFPLRLKRFPVKGWGVILDGNRPIPPRTFVSRYVGEIITVQEAEERGKIYEPLGVTYLFDLDYSTDQGPVYSVDAFYQGNESRFFNHSCDPNLSVYNLTGGDYAGDAHLMTLSFWSNRYINPGDELTFDYNGQFVQEWFKEDRSSRNEKRRDPQEKKTPCACGAANCQKWVHL